MKPYLAVNAIMQTKMLPLIKHEALLFDQITFVHNEGISAFAQSEVRFVNWRLFVSWDQPIESRLTNDLKAVWFQINDDNTLRRYDWSE